MGGVESTQVTAGVTGFIVLFLLAIACWLLFRSMSGHLRRLDWREEREQRQAAEAARRARGGQQRTDDSPDATDGAPGHRGPR